MTLSRDGNARLPILRRPTPGHGGPRPFPGRGIIFILGGAAPSHARLPRQLTQHNSTLQQLQSESLSVLCWRDSTTRSTLAPDFDGSSSLAEDHFGVSGSKRNAA